MHWKGKWYDEVRSKTAELADTKFDLIWLPPNSNGEGAGYHPHELNNLNSNYGHEASRKAAIKALLTKGIEPIADIVINHRTYEERLVDLHESELAVNYYLFR